MKDFCPLCYGSIAVDDESIRCKRCGSIFDVDGNVLEQHNAHMQKAVAKASPLVVTRGDGVPLPDQAAAIEEFKRQALKPAVTDTYAVMQGTSGVMEYCAVEVLSRNLTTGEVKLTRIPLSEWPEWARELRPGHGN